MSAWVPEASDWVAQTHRQDFAIRFTHPTQGSLILSVEECQIGWDESRAPRVMANLTCQIPASQSTLDLLDPRQGVRVEIDAGYIWGDGTRDVHTIANLGLRDRRVVRPDNVLELDCASDEALVADNKSDESYTPPQTTGLQNGTTQRYGLEWAAHALVEKGMLRFVDWNNTSTSTNDPAETVSVEPGDDYWNLIKDLADRADAEVFDDGMRNWIFRPRPSTTSTPAGSLAVGVDGTVFESDTGLSREAEWANAVVLVYEWTDSAGIDHKVVGYAEAVGPHTPDATVGRKVHYEQIDNITTSQVEANRVAKAILKRRLAFGRTFNLRAVSQYWLRPGMTVAVQLPLGPEEKHLVSSVTFDLMGGWMAVATRQPDGVSVPQD